MTSWKEAYTSLLQLYKSLMFPKDPHAKKWTLAEIDQLDAHFFFDVLSVEGVEHQKHEKDVYLSDIW